MPLSMFEAPKFNSSSDPELWLYRYAKVADMNNWGEETMLKYVDNCFKQSLQVWFMQQDFKSWPQFKNAFLLKFAKKVNMDKIAADIINFKMNQNESVLNYIERFDKKKMQYNNEVVKRTTRTPTSIKQSEPSIKRESKSTKNETSEATTSTAITPIQETSNLEFMITESGFLKYFIKGITIKTLKRHLKLEKPSTIEDAYSIIREMYDSDDEGDTSDAQEDINKSSDESSDDESVQPKSTNKTPKTKKTGTVQPLKDDTISAMISEFKNMSLMIGELVTVVSKSDPKKKKTTCWNCMSSEHYTKDCVQPCKLCNNPGHKHYECKLYKNNHTNKTSNNSNIESMLIEDNYMAEKRKLDDEESQKDSSRNIRITRSGGTYPTPKRKKKMVLPVDDVVMVENTEITKDPDVTKASAPITTPIESPKHPLRLNVRNKADVESREKRIDTIVDHVINEPVHLISLNDLAAICTPSARTRIKNKMIKPQTAKRLNKSYQTVSDKAALLGEVMSNDPPKGKSAPRTYGKVNGQECELILDGGCTSYIVSLNFLRRLGITEVEPSNSSVMFGDGNSYPPIGLATNLKLQIGGSQLISVKALCYDVGDKYDFIVGREGLHALKIGTDWSSHYWYIKTEDGVLPVDVHYTRNYCRENIDSSEEDEFSEDEQEEDVIDQDDWEEGYLIVAASDEEDNDGDCNTANTNDQEQRLGTLISRINEQENLSDQEKTRLIEIMLKFKDCFGTGYEHLSQTNLLKFHVDTGKSKPIYKRPYGFLSLSEKQMLKRDLEEMVENGILVPNTHVPGNSAHSGWSFPCRYVPKKTGDKRLVTNFKELNAVTVRDTWPLPNLVDVIESLAGAKWFGVLDLLKAFQQIAVEEQSVPKLTIATPWGAYSYRCVPFGVLNGPSAFSRCVYLAIQPFIDKFATNYLDDVTLYAKSKEEHMTHIEEFLTRMREVNLKLNAEKCDFFQTQITLLGFEISEHGVNPSASKIAKIQEFPRPVNETGIRAFVNLCGFYRRHIPLFADLAAPMNELLKKRNPFIWSESCEESFKSLKQALLESVTLVIPDANTKYNLYCDASEVGIGACLSAIMDNGDERPVLFLSRKLQPVETRYPVVEKELLAIVYALRKLRKYLLDREFVLFCDNSAVCYLFNKNEPSQRLQRWIMCTQEFTFTTKHISSVKNCVADALSRFPSRYDNDKEDGEDHIDALFDHLLLDENNACSYEPWLQDLVFYFNFPGNSKNTNATKRLSLKYAYDNGILYRKVGQRLVCVPCIEERPKILTEVHDGHGHFGINATWARLYKDYWWPKCYEEVHNYIKTCRECQLYSSPIKNPASDRVPINYIFEQFSLDFVGPLPTSKYGNLHILVAVEAFTRWPIAIATKNTEAKTVANFLYKHIFCTFGPPLHILTDNGAAFDNQIVDNFLNLVNVHHKFTSPYRPSTNGQTEQMNGNIVKALKKLTIDNPTDWDEHLDAVLYAYRTKSHSVLKMSPYEFMFGIAPNSVRQDPLQLLGRAMGMERLTQLSDRNIQVQDYNALNEYDPKPVIRRKYFEPGTKVVRVRHNKFSKMDTNFKPEIFTVISCFNNGTCQLADKVGRLLKRRVNISSLRQIFQRE